jgi:hypothetical protein
MQMSAMTGAVIRVHRCIHIFKEIVESLAAVSYLCIQSMWGNEK